MEKFRDILKLVEQDVTKREGPFKCLHKYSIDFGAGDNYGHYTGVGVDHRVQYEHKENLSENVRLIFVIGFYSDFIVYFNVGCKWTTSGKEQIKTVKYSGIFGCNSEEGGDGYIKNFQFDEVVVDKDELHPRPTNTTKGMPINFGDFPEGVKISQMTLEEFANKIKDSFKLK